MKAKFMFSLICVAAVTLTACEQYPYGYWSPYSYGGGYAYPYGGYRYGYDGYGYPYGGYSGIRYYGGHRRHPYYHRGHWEDQGDQGHQGDQDGQ